MKQQLKFRIEPKEQAEIEKIKKATHGTLTFSGGLHATYIMEEQEKVGLCGHVLVTTDKEEPAYLGDAEAIAAAFGLNGVCEVWIEDSNPNAIHILGKLE